MRIKYDVLINDNNRNDKIYVLFYKTKKCESKNRILPIKNHCLQY